MEKSSINQSIEELTQALLELVDETCWNNVSSNCKYILTKIDDETEARQTMLERKKQNDAKKPISLNELSAQLEAIFNDLYDINLFIYKSKKRLTIIEVKYYLKSSFFGTTHFDLVKDNTPMTHCKIKHPIYITSLYGKPKKFDVNWELGGWRHQWNLFLLKLRHYSGVYPYQNNTRASL